MVLIIIKYLCFPLETLDSKNRLFCSLREAAHSPEFWPRSIWWSSPIPPCSICPDNEILQTPIPILPAAPAKQLKSRGKGRFELPGRKFRRDTKD